MKTKVFIVTLTGDVDAEKLSKWAWAELPIQNINVTEIVGAKDAEIISQQVQIKT